MKINLIKQEKSYTCACACLRMVFSTFNMQDVPEEELEYLLDTDDISGTSLTDFIVTATQDFNLKVLTKENTSLEKVEKLFSKGYAIILLISTEIPHMVIYDGIENDILHILDPALGRISIDKNVFESNSQKYPNYRWRVIKSEFNHLKEFDFENLNIHKSIIALKPND